MKSGLIFFVAVISLIFLLTCSLSFAEKPAPSFDLIITNGHIIDGTGSPWYSGDIGISNGKITAIGNLSETARKHTIDAREMIVAPGFIDMLGLRKLRFWLIHGCRRRFTRASLQRLRAKAGQLRL